VSESGRLSAHQVGALRYQAHAGALRYLACGGARSAAGGCPGLIPGSAGRGGTAAMRAGSGRTGAGAGLRPARPARSGGEGSGGSRRAFLPKQAVARYEIWRAATCGRPCPACDTIAVPPPVASRPIGHPAAFTSQVLLELVRAETSAHCCPSSGALSTSGAPHLPIPRELTGLGTARGCNATAPAWGPRWGYGGLVGPP
jgi:hypothetical protein